MEPLLYKRSTLAQRKAHLEAVVGQEFSALFYYASDSAARRRILQDSKSANNDQGTLCISQSQKLS